MNNRAKFLKQGAIALAISAAVCANAEAGGFRHSIESFNRVSSFAAFNNTDIGTQSVAEIVAASEDGMTLVYTDSANNAVGFTNIANPAAPTAAGIVDVGGEPTSVGVIGNYALVCVNTSEDYVNVSGQLLVIDIDSHAIVRTLPLGGQPDAVAVSKDGNYAAIAIENERDEDLGDGGLPQAPAGKLVIVDTAGAVAAWATRDVAMTGLADIAPEDPEPEYVDINSRNEAVVTLQENNYIVIVDLASGDIVRHFSAGTVDLDKVDTLENDLIEQTASLSDVPREPDGVTWINDYLFATANEGDWQGGSRGFSIFNKFGKVVYDAGNSVDHAVARIGHYPEGRSENKGNEPENVEYGRFGNTDYLFVASERSSVILVYKLIRGRFPVHVQTLPASVGPEGVLAIPQRNLLIAASEEDERGDKYRSVLNVYQLGKGRPDYPTIVSANRDNGAPIPWAALSGLALNPDFPFIGYTIPDSFYEKSRIFTMVMSQPALILKETVLQDTNGVMAAFDASMVNGDGSINLDQEGIASRANGGFWVASEGSGTVGDPNRPVTSKNLLLAVAEDGAIEQVVTLPDTTNDRQLRFGFEGVTVTGAGDSEVLWTVIQREWADDPDGHVRIGRYQLATGEWTFYYYPLETPQSAAGGWVGLSEIAALGNDEFAVIERDNQGGADAVIKRIYKFSVAGLQPKADTAVGTTPDFPVVSKQLVRDLVPDLAAKNGQILEKIESLAVTPRGDAIIINDNDGVDDNSGETQLIRFKKLF